MNVDEMLVGEMLSVWLALAYAVMAAGREAFAQLLVLSKTLLMAPVTITKMRASMVYFVKKDIEAMLMRVWGCFDKRCDVFLRAAWCVMYWSSSV